MLQEIFKGLCSDASMPDTLTIIKNGTETVLMKNADAEGSVFYVGTPRFKGRNGNMRGGQHALILTPDCRVEGTYALNSIAVGGWKPGISIDPGHEARNTIKEELLNTLVTAGFLAQRGEEVTGTPLATAVQRESGFPVIKAPMSDSQKEMLAAAGVRGHIFDLLESRGWSLEIYPSDLIGPLKSYCEVVKGAWSMEARAIATTAALPYAKVMAIRGLGYTIRKIGRYSRENSANS